MRADPCPSVHSHLTAPVVPVGDDDVRALLNSAKRQRTPCAARTQHHDALPRQGGLRS